MMFEVRDAREFSIVDFPAQPYNGMALRLVIKNLIQAKKNKIVLNLSAVAKMDAHVLGLVVGVLKKTRAVHGQLAIVSDHEWIKTWWARAAIKDKVLLCATERDLPNTW